MGMSVCISLPAGDHGDLRPYPAKEKFPGGFLCAMMPDFEHSDLPAILLCKIILGCTVKISHKQCGEILPYKM